MADELKKIPIALPSIGEAEIKAVNEVLRSGWITAGPKTVEFEHAFSAYTGTRDAIAVNSCTSALFMCLQALDLEPGSDVMVPALTWPSAIAACLYLGYKPVLVDIDPVTLNISPEDIKKKLTSKTRAIVPVHFSGLPYDIHAIEEIVEGTSIALIDDAAHALGTRCDGHQVGQYALASCYSFHPIKNITTGEGGMITCNDKNLAEKLRRLRLLGVTRDAWKRYGASNSSEYDVVELSLKHNMTDIQAALGIVQLGRLNELNTKRANLAMRYVEKLSVINNIILPVLPKDGQVHSWHLFIVRTPEMKGKYSRQKIIERLSEARISTGIHFIAIPDLTFYRKRMNIDPADTPFAVEVGRTVLSLPLYPDLSIEDQDRVIREVYRAFGKN
jgi:UDP-4-amino-4-deoxy-L-arabinose-oxoglutarate aminotransferase